MNRNPQIKEAYNLFHNGILALAKAERNGLRIDLEYCAKQQRKLNNRIRILEEKLKETKFWRHWVHTLGGREPNMDSPTQLSNYLYNVKKIKPAKTTDSGAGSTDDEALRALELPELDLLLETRKLKKILNTYIEGLTREQVNGFIHPFFNLHLVKTYRSSSDSPNFQNFPKRDKEAMQIIRSAIYPRIGHQLMEVDFSGLEVSIAACYHKDPTMLKYLREGGDFHADVAKQIFFISDFNKGISAHSLLRSTTKNAFVFPQFYGDYYKNNAVGICQWLELPLHKWQGTEGKKLYAVKPISEHFMENGVGSFNDLCDHLKGIEHHFWSKRFPVYAEWKERQHRLYQKRGYADTYTGFRFTGEMRKNEVINYPVQGAAFHCLLWCFIEIQKELEGSELDTRIVGQIHDAVDLDVNPSELITVKEILKEVTMKRLAAAWAWINVPLKVEAEISPIDGSWAELSPCEL